MSRCRAAGAGGVRGADLEVRGRTGTLFVSGPRTLPGVRPESDPELCFLTGKGRVRAGSPGSELRNSGCELRVTPSANWCEAISPDLKVRLGPEARTLKGCLVPETGCVPPCSLLWPLCSPRCDAYTATCAELKAGFGLGSPGSLDLSLGFACVSLEVKR